MAYNYKYCDGSTTLTTSISMTQGATQVRTYQNAYGDTIIEEYAILTFTSAAGAVTTGFYINYTFEYYNDITGTWIPQYGTVYLPTNQSQITKEVLITKEDIVGSFSEEWKNYNLEPQSSIPVCYVPPSCTLVITSTTPTDVTIQGGSDGQIVAVAGGYTGTTLQWYIDGTLDAGTGLTNTFTGLTAGLYQITVEEGICSAQENDVQVLDGEFRTGDFNVTNPADLTASENPVIYQIRTEQVGEGKQAEMQFKINGTVTNGDYYVFNLESPYSYSQTFYAKGFPNKSNYFLASTLTDSDGTSVGTNTDAEIAQSLADALQQDILIPKVYTVSYDGDITINLKAKEYGERFTLSVDNVLLSGTNLSRTRIQSGVNKYDGQQVDGYSIGTELFLNQNLLQYPSTGITTDYVRIAELELPFSQDNTHNFDLAPILKNFVFSNRPELNFTGSTIMPDTMKPYFIRIFEKYPLVQNTNTKKKRFKTSDTVKWVTNSALDHYSINDMSGYTSSGGYTFLTSAPNPKLIQRDSQEFLYFIVETDLGHTLDVRGDLTFWDGTSESNVNYFTISTGATNAGGVMMLNISYDKLGLESYETYSGGTRKIKNATFAVYLNSAQYTEERTYHFEIEDKPRKFGINFSNSLGGYDSFDFIGIVENTVSRTSGTYTSPINYNQDGSAPQGFKSKSTFDTKVTNQITCNSGWINLDHFIWLKEMLKANDIYSYTTDDQNYLNVIGYKYKRSSLDDLYEMEISLEQTVYENNVSI